MSHGGDSMAKRENGTGSIIKRKMKNGTYYLAYAPAKYLSDEDGNTSCVREKLGRFQTKAGARQVLEDYARHPTSKYNFTLEMLYAEWSAFAFSGISSQTTTNYKAAWAKVKDCPGIDVTGKPMREITTGELRAVLDYYKLPRTENGVEVKPLSKSYLTKIKALLTQLYNYAMENNIVDRNYAALIKLTGMEDKPKRSFTDLEFATLEKNYQDVAGGDAVYALCYLGFRVSEFCELTPFSYDPQAKTLTGGKKTAAGKNRVVPVHEKIQPIIEKWYARKCDTLYADPDGKPYNKDSFARKVWRPALRAMGLPDDLTPHSARHTCATRLSKGGARPEDIQKILGHEDYSVTANTYIGQDVTTLRAAMAKMG